MKERSSRPNGRVKDAAPALFESGAGGRAATGKDKSLETWIWDAACSIRGAQDAPKYKDFILPLIFTKRLGWALRWRVTSR